MQSHLSVHYTTTPKQVSHPPRKRAIPLQPHTFRVDNAIYDHYGPIIGAIGYAVYCAYSRYANRITGECYPAVETIATKLDLSIPTVIKKRNLLAELGLLSFKERFGPSGRQTTHLTIVHTVDELEGRGKTALAQDPTPRGKTALPLVEQADLTSSGASAEQEKTYTRRILEHSMDALKVVEQEQQETDKQQAKIDALDEATRQTLEAEALEAILQSDPEAKRGFVARGHLHQVMYQLYEARQLSDQRLDQVDAQQHLGQDANHIIDQGVGQQHLDQDIDPLCIDQTIGQLGQNADDQGVGQQHLGQDMDHIHGIDHVIAQQPIDQHLGQFNQVVTQYVASPLSDQHVAQQHPGQDMDHIIDQGLDQRHTEQHSVNKAMASMPETHALVDVTPLGGLHHHQDAVQGTDQRSDVHGTAKTVDQLPIGQDITDVLEQLHIANDVIEPLHIANQVPNRQDIANQVRGLVIQRQDTDVATPEVVVRPYRPAEA